jgi:hypothetical protein
MLGKIDPAPPMFLPDVCIVVEPDVIAMFDTQVYIADRSDSADKAVCVPAWIPPEAALGEENATPIVDGAPTIPY